LHATPKACGSAPASPFAAVFPHQRNNAVANLKKALLQNRVLRWSNKFIGKEPGRGLERHRDRFQCALQISDRHPDFIHIVIA
jgi:hypothetical protein